HAKTGSAVAKYVFGENEAPHKQTYLSMFGMENAKKEVKKHCEHCYDILNKNGYNSKILCGILGDITERVC
ncbi:MAG: hypothetical protein ACI37T_02550, partial [Candidatus Gastranaerophilaceae bacterium]